MGKRLAKAVLAVTFCLTMYPVVAVGFVLGLVWESLMTGHFWAKRFERYCVGD